jgi:PAS domain S-box-containing protein
MALPPESSADEALSEAHARIVQSEERWRSVFENSAIGVVLADLNGRIIAANPVFLNMLEYTEEELGQFSFIDITVEEDRKLNRVLIEELLTGKRKQFQIEKRYRRKNGNTVWARTSVSVVPGTERVPRFLMALSEDVSDRKRTEEALKSSERELSSIINTIPTLAWSAAADGSVTFLNQRWLDYTGLSTEDARDWGWKVAIHPDDSAALVQYWQSRLAAGEPGDVETRLRRSDGVYRWFLIRFEPFRDEAGKILRWYGTTTDIEDRKRAEEELKASESRFRAIIDTIPTMAWSTHPDGYCDYVNRRWLETTGLSSEESLGWNWGAAIHPDDLKDLVEYWQGCLASGATVNVEARMRLFDGAYRWFLFRASPLRDESGTIVKWYGTNTDIDDRKRAEDALRASELTLRETVDNIPGLVAKTNPTGGLEFLNRRTLEYFGKSIEEMESWAVDGTIHPDDVRGVIEARKKSIEEWKPYEYEVRCRRADGIYRWFQVRGGLPLRDAKGALTSRYLLLTDIEDRRLAEEEVRRKEDFLATAQRLSLSGSFSWCLDTNEVVFSEEAYRIFEFDRHLPVTLQQIDNRIHPEDRHLLPEKRKEASTLGEGQDYQIRLLMPNGSIKYLHTTSTETRDTSGRRQYIGALQDVTQRWLAEGALNKARTELAHVARVTALSALTASIAHEVNQPLSGIVTNAGTCLRMLDASPPNLEGARETARRTIRDGNRASEVITRLRALFSKTSTTFESFDLNETAEEVIALSLSELRRNGVVLQLDLGVGLPSVFGDRIQIQQVILNLLRNASDAMSAVSDRPKELLVKTEREESAGSLRLSVKDAGVGITPEIEEKLFEAFYTTKDDGMGIGLSVSRSIMESHQGRLWATRNDGPGSTFSFSMPCNRTDT